MGWHYSLVFDFMVKNSQYHDVGKSRVICIVKNVVSVVHKFAHYGKQYQVISNNSRNLSIHNQTLASKRIFPKMSVMCSLCCLAYCKGLQYIAVHCIALQCIAVSCTSLFCSSRIVDMQNVTTVATIGCVKFSITIYI